MTLMKNYGGSFHISSLRRPSKSVLRVAVLFLNPREQCSTCSVFVDSIRPRRARMHVNLHASSEAPFCGRLSLCAALAAGHLVQAHVAHDRSAPASAAPSRSVSPFGGSRIASGPNNGPKMSVAAVERSRR
ncbi:hypothetical protein N7497_006745 [Penicillium chrysogenum]|uniref:C2H2-type domain-containing protein n=1 Tax=Penicillium chrysogenum TaxID=5076 RepID=A0ABQ8W562_PENCH|nr:hypothetical protein N7505_010920 [Penicillium chrysogenum]KAJ6152426.1 hypothetical protein N7497_006745 [Penicillium chrysogenum]